ncbi:hypothetical protein C2E20_0581 [Micractinium conductrix]|uniref:Uncharacterized protein n=1 Tax=Micractinium conductrix TaxID=554055 RepID=A0A2P6VQB8_9CHLO|nr:hypothetical protein C2E20_0581 [Micractinium conductrix]PSC76295.1 hypothetical protein C2E20_0581 [Micractinium conductrix]|eukprot:PSC76294.1 hypothetical protein C2E20_0581 [Micractinium conductrix]
MASLPSGTSQFFLDFFPAAHAALQHRLPNLWDQMQPGWLAAACPEVALPLGCSGCSGGSGAAAPFLLRNPSLLPVQLAGVAVAVAGLVHLRAPRWAYLRASLLFFAAMQTSSIVCHVLATRGSGLWHAALLADVAATGASSLCLLASQALPAPTTTAGAAAATRRCWAGAAAVVAGVATLRSLPWVPEATYIGTTALASAATGLGLLRRWAALPAHARVRHLPALALAGLGVAAMVLSLPLDPLLCAAAGPWLGTVPVLFAGCDLGFAALVLLAADGEGLAAAGGGRAEKAD